MLAEDGLAAFMEAVVTTEHGGRTATDATTGVPLTESQTEATMENAEIDSTTAAHKSAAATTAVLAQTGSSQCAVEETGSTTGTKD